jgi:hypothetical protein
MSPRAIAQGRSAHAVRRWLHSRGRDVPALSLHRPVDLGDEPAAGREAIEQSIRLALAVPSGEMIALDTPTTHIATDRPEVQHALRHACRMPGDPIDHLERCLDDVLACLHSPKVRHTVAKLADELIRAPRGELAAEDALRSIVLAMGETAPSGDDQPAHPRTIWVR